MRILVIEDNHRLDSSLASSLTHEGYSVDSAFDGQEGQDVESKIGAGSLFEVRLPLLNKVEE
jgi:DNA-binding response OmpR family regulator